jgi:hypothetical protein
MFSEYIRKDTAWTCEVYIYEESISINMGKMTWILDEIENCVIVTRVIDTGEQDEDQQAVLKVSRVSRDNPLQGITEIRASLDMLEKELRNGEKPEIQTKTTK